MFGILRVVFQVARVVGVPGICAVKGGALHGFDEVRVGFFVDAEGFDGDVFESRVGLVCTSEPASVGCDGCGDGGFGEVFGFAFGVEHANDGGGIGVEEVGGFVKILFVEFLVGPLAVGEFVDGVDVSVHVLDEFIEAFFDRYSGHCETCCCYHPLRVMLGETPYLVLESAMAMRCSFLRTDWTHGTATPIVAHPNSGIPAQVIKQSCHADIELLQRVVFLDFPCTRTTVA